MMEIKTILMLTEKYAEKSNIASKIAWTVTPYRITLPYGLHALHSRPYLDWQIQSNTKDSGEFYSFQQKVWTCSWKGYDQTKEYASYAFAYVLWFTQWHVILLV